MQTSVPFLLKSTTWRIENGKEPGALTLARETSTSMESWRATRLILWSCVCVCVCVCVSTDFFPRSSFKWSRRVVKASGGMLQADCDTGQVRQQTSPPYIYECQAQWQTDRAGPIQRVRGSSSSTLSQKHPLQAVGGHAALVLRLGVALGVGAAGRGALWGAQVVHEGQPVLPTEVHKLDLAHPRIKVDAWVKQRGTGANGMHVNLWIRQRRSRFILDQTTTQEPVNTGGDRDRTKGFPKKHIHARQTYAYCCQVSF